jgi:probable rRNA maturation factor
MIALMISGRSPSVLDRKTFAAVERGLERELRTGKKKLEAGVMFAGPGKVARLNASYRGKTGATDVLSFSAREGVRVDPDDADLGDILICPSVAKRNAAERGILYREELVRLLVHGVLHLLGYDHERKADERTMFVIQERVVSKVCST